MAFGFGSAFKRAVRHPKKVLTGELATEELGRLGDKWGLIDGPKAPPPAPGIPGSAGFDERYYAGPEGDPKELGTYLTREPGTTGATGGTPPPGMGGKGGNRNMNDQRPRQSLSQQGPNFESASNPFARIAQQMGVEGGYTPPAPPSSQWGSAHRGQRGTPPPGMGGKGGRSGDPGFVASNPLLARARPSNANYSGMIQGQSPSTGARRNQAASGMQRRSLPNMNAKKYPTGSGGGNV
jgi:hypothetical protein